METTIKRKQTTFDQSDNIGRNYNHPVYDATHSVDEAKRFNQLVSSEPRFQYGGLILQGLAPPLFVLFAFGGKPAITALCFGALVSYIFDLLGAIEVNLKYALRIFFQSILY